MKDTIAMTIARSPNLIMYEVITEVGKVPSSINNSER